MLLYGMLEGIYFVSYMPEKSERLHFSFSAVLLLVFFLELSRGILVDRCLPYLSVCVIIPSHE